MPIVIGGKPESSFADPIGLLIDCHRRIERFLAVLARVGEQARGGPLTAEQGAALETALRYFREAAPKHTADEEQTLFPLLRSLDSQEVIAVLSKVDALEHQHAEADRSHAEIDRLGAKWLAGGSLSTEEAQRFSSLIAALTELYEGHIAVEEGELFPTAAAALDPREREAIGSEMAARRGLS